MMARGVVGTGFARSIPQIGDPPRSTAAQLVNHLADGKKHPKVQDHEIFRQLLREVLGTENEHGGHGALIETDSQVNYKLINVILKAGLDVVAPDDPFGGSRELRSQAIESLSAIELTIRRDPAVMIVISPFREGDPKPQAPLYLWLVPKMLALISLRSDDAVTAGILQLLEAMLAKERYIQVQTSGKRSILRYIQLCVKGRTSRLFLFSMDS